MIDVQLYVIDVISAEFDVFSVRNLNFGPKTTCIKDHIGKSVTVTTRFSRILSKIPSDHVVTGECIVSLDCGYIQVVSSWTICISTGCKIGPSSSYVETNYL